MVDSILFAAAFVVGQRGSLSSNSGGAFFMVNLCWGRMTGSVGRYTNTTILSVRNGVNYVSPHRPLFQPIQMVPADEQRKIARGSVSLLGSQHNLPGEFLMSSFFLFGPFGAGLVSDAHWTTCLLSAAWRLALDTIQ